MMSRCVAAIALSMCLSALGQAAQATITYESPGQRVDALLRQLSPKLGQALTASKSVANDVIALSVDKVSSQDLLTRIADQLHASWEKQADAWVLTRSPRQSREQREWERDREITNLKKIQKDLEKEVQAQGPFNSEAALKLSQDLHNQLNASESQIANGSYYKTQLALESRGPLGRGLSKLRLLIPADDLVDLPAGIRVVYSTSANSLQRQLPSAAIDTIGEMVHEQSEWANAQSGFPSDRIGWGGYLIFYSHSFEAVPTTAWIVVSRFSRSSDYSFELKLASASGQIVAELRRTLPMALSSAATAPPVLNDPPLTISSEAQTFASAARTSSVVPPGLLPKLLNPDQTDPLSLAIGPSLIAAAKSKNENLVAVVSDRFWQLTPLLAVPGQLTVERFLNQVSTCGLVREDSGWLTVSPLTPYADREAAVDRTTLTAFIRDRANSKRFTLDQSAKWAINLPRARDNELPRAYERLLLGSATGPIQNENLLRLYGAMTPEMRSAAASKSGLPFDNLSSEVQQELNPIIFGVGSSLSQTISTESLSRNGGWLGNSLLLEPTLRFGRGFPAISRLRIGVTDSSAVTTDDGNQYSTASFASALVTLTSPDMFPPGTQKPINMNRLTLCGFRELMFTLTFEPSIQLSPGELTETTPSDYTDVRYADLPATFQKTVESQMATLKSAYTHMHLRAPQPKTPPPQP